MKLLDWISTFVLLLTWALAEAEETWLLPQPVGLAVASHAPEPPFPKPDELGSVGSEQDVPNCPQNNLLPEEIGVVAALKKVSVSLSPRSIEAFTPSRTASPEEKRPSVVVIVLPLNGAGPLPEALRLLILAVVIPPTAPSPMVLLIVPPGAGSKEEVAPAFMPEVLWAFTEVPNVVFVPKDKEARLPV